MAGPILAPNPYGIEAGEIGVGLSRDFPCYIQNTGDSDLEFTNVVSSTPDITTPLISLPQTIPAGGFYLVTFRVTPSSPGTIDGNVTLVSNGINNPVIQEIVYTGIAGGTAALTISPPNWTFPNTKLGEESPEQLFTVSNTNNVDVTISAYTYPSDFAAGATNPALPIVLHPGDTYQFGIKYVPLAQGYISEVVEIVSDAVAGDFGLVVNGTAYLIIPDFIVSGIEERLMFAFVLPTGVVITVSGDPLSFDSDGDCQIQKLTNLGQYAVDKVLKYFWYHYEDHGYCEVRVTFSNQVTGETTTSNRIIGTVPANEKVLLDIFEVTMEGENILVTIFKEAGRGWLSIIDYGFKFLSCQEQLGTTANPVSITPAFVVSGLNDILMFAFDLSGTEETKQMDSTDFACDDATPVVSKQVMLPIPTEQGSIPGFTYEKQIMRIFFHYEDFGVAVVKFRLTTMRGQTSEQNVSLGSVTADGALKIGIADLVVVDEVVKVELEWVSGPLMLVDYTSKYVLKGERAK